MKKKGDKYYFQAIASQRNKRTWDWLEGYNAYTAIRIKI